MDIVAILIIIIIAIILVLTFYIIGLYNRLIDSKNKIEDKFNQIDIELKNKLDLIPNLIDTISSLTKHEEKTINELSSSATKLEKSKNINDKIVNSNNMNRAINKIFNLIDTYPELKKNKNFQIVQKKLEECDDKINYAKTFYNDVVLDYNNLREEFPSNLVSKAFKFKEINYYK